MRPERVKNLKKQLTIGLLLSTSIIVGGVAASKVLGQSACSGGQILTAKSCAGDLNSAEEKALFQLVNDYRAASRLPAVRLSQSLSIVANRRMLDLKQNLKTLTHSWSNCRYDLKDENTWHCVTEAPRKLNSGYSGQGYETLYRAGKGSVSPVVALDAWKKSPLHNSIILNGGMFKDMPWDEVGIAIDGEYAALWFGYPGTALTPPGGRVVGIGVTYDQAVAGLSKLLSIDQTSSTVESNKWQGFSADKKIKLEIYGSRSDISEANLAIAVRLESNQKLSAQSKLALETLLKNLFPEWPDREAWLKGAVDAIALNQNASRTKLVRKIAIEMRSDGANSLKLTVKPQGKPAYIEVFD